MKKLLSLALALAICLGLMVPAFAVGNPGEYTASDGKGHTFTLESPILYTFSRETAKTSIDWSSVTVTGVNGSPLTGQAAIDYLNRDFWPTFDTVYVIPSEAKVTLPAGYHGLGFIEMLVLKDGGSLRSTSTAYTKLSGQGDRVSGVSEEVEESLICWCAGNGSDTAYIATYIPQNPAAPNPFANVPAPATPTVGTFTDVAPGAFYAEPVAWAVEKKITNGTGTTAFSPNNKCNIEQIITFLWRVAGSPASNARCPFTGVAQSSSYYTALCWANEKGILKGEATQAGNDCTRMMAVNFMYRYMNSPASGSSTAFTDVSAANAPAVAWAVKNGITNGTGNGKFSPNKTCTRGEIVTFLYRAFANK